MMTTKLMTVLAAVLLGACAVEGVPRVSRSRICVASIAPIRWDWMCLSRGSAGSWHRTSGLSGRPPTGPGR